MPDDFAWLPTCQNPWLVAPAGFSLGRKDADADFELGFHYAVERSGFVAVGMIASALFGATDSVSWVVLEL